MNKEELVDLLREHLRISICSTNYQQDDQITVSLPMYKLMKVSGDDEEFNDIQYDELERCSQNKLGW